MEINDFWTTGTALVAPLVRPNAQALQGFLVRYSLSRSAVNPIGRAFGTGGAISARIAE